MKLLTFKTGDLGPRIGAWLHGEIIDIAQAAAQLGADDEVPATIKEMLERGPAAIALVRRILDASASLTAAPAVRLKRADVVLLPPIPDPSKFLCIGKNNRGHLEELESNKLIAEIPQEPTGFIKLNTVLVGDGARVARPQGVTTLDYEPELVVAIGRLAHRVSRHDALSHVAGITLVNDLTAREVQKREVASGTRFWTSKNMPGFGPLGPYLTTLDEIADPHDLWITCAVNGQQRMRSHTGDVIFRIGEVLEHFSRWMPFLPGDLIALGAPAGVAVGQPNAAELYLKPGDVIDIAFEGEPALRTFITKPEEAR